jgi:hypothetical protein
MMKEVLTAVAKATGEMRRVAKEGRNVEQKYDFASIDDFLAMTGPVLAANGLVILTEESTVEYFERQGKYNLTTWVRIEFQFTVYHLSGESLPQVTRTVETILTGPQAYGSAQSYALKQFQRGLFMIPTGDNDDPDQGPRAEGPITKPADRPSAVDEAKAALAGAETLDALVAVWKGLPGSVQGDPGVFDAKEARKAALKQPDPIQENETLPY